MEDLGVDRAVGARRALLLRQLKEPSRLADVPKKLWLELGKGGVGVNEAGIGKAPVTRWRRIKSLGDGVPHVIKEGCVTFLELSLASIQFCDN